MKNEKISNIILIIVCFVLIGVIVILYDKAFLNNETIIESKETVKISDKTIAIMYETGVESGEYVASDETTWPSEGYVFNTALSKCENGSSISYDGTNVKVLANKSDRCYVYFDREVIRLADYIKRLYSSENEGKNGLYLHDGSGDYTNVDLEAGDGSYRYSGANVNNYVCFASDTDPCPTESLYRIIGVYGNNVKLIKYDYASLNMLGDASLAANPSWTPTTSYKENLSTIPLYYWSGSSDTTSTNTWVSSTLNRNVLNVEYINYLNNLDSKWIGSIDDTTWYVAGINSSHVYGTDQETGLDNSAKTTYDWEVGDNATKEGEYTATDGSTEEAQYIDKIGLIYVNEYMYAAEPTYWSYPGLTAAGWLNQDGLYGEDYDYRAAIQDNWMYMGVAELTISRAHDGIVGAYQIGTPGNVAYPPVYNSSGAIRPVFMLKSTTNYIEGIGTSDDPYQIF